MKKERMIEELARIDGRYDQLCDCIEIAEDLGGMSSAIDIFTEDDDYLNDHNACQRLVDGMDDATIEWFIIHMADVLFCSTYTTAARNASLIYKIPKATCQQKCKAILKAYGKFEEEE